MQSAAGVAALKKEVGGGFIAAAASPRGAARFMQPQQWTSDEKSENSHVLLG